MKAMSDRGYWTVLRLRPFIIGISDVDIEILLQRAKDNGCNAISMEFFAMDYRCLGGFEGKALKNIDDMSKLAGFDIIKMYKDTSPSERGGYLRSNRDVKEYFVKKMDIRCHNWDDDGLDNYPVSWTKEINIHAIRLSYFLDANYFWSHVLYRLQDTLTLYSQCEMDNLYYLYRRHDIEYALRIVDLLKYSGKSNFTNSLKSQVLTWLCVEDTDHKYTKPLSDKQFLSMTKFDRENIIRRSRYGNNY